MNDARLRILQAAPDQLLADLDARDVAVWLMPAFAEAAGPEIAAQVLKLPWSLVLSEVGDASLLTALDDQEGPDDPLVRRRGLVQLVDANPADVPLPRRSLPVFLLNGRPGAAPAGLAALTQRLTMLQELERRSVKQLVVLAGPDARMPLHLDELSAGGLRIPITVVTDASQADQALLGWADAAKASNIWIIPREAAAFARDLVSRYLVGRDERLLLRVRDGRGGLRTLDITGKDDPQHPLLGRYNLISEDLLLPLAAEDLQPGEVQDFFRNPSGSWRPYAAGVPWERVPDGWNKLRSALGTLDQEGPSANRIFYVQAESGAGATTFLRTLAWRAAEQGYPALVAGAAPFSPMALEVIAFLDKATGSPANEGDEDEERRLYQPPAVIVFDGHWEGREDQLIRFAREFEQSGRRACFLFATGPYLPMQMLGDRRFNQLAELSHEISPDAAADLGRHLNAFLARHGGTRSESEWRRFVETSSVAADQGIASFWIALSFWLQRQFDMQETVQAWVYRQFKEAATDGELRTALVSIAAFSTERLPLPEAMLPAGKDWPVSDRLADLQSNAGALGLIRIRDERERYWTLIHDILGRFILTALFYDHDARTELGFGDAQNPEHLRFLALSKLATLRVLERPDLREVADAYATSIFKIDPAQGRSAFVFYWRDALAALDEMPRSLRTTSRTFLHHTAISRRRIAKDTELFPLTLEERIALLSRAVADIESGLAINDEVSGETDLNLLNSLAHAYHDLAEAEQACGAAADRVHDLQGRARDATRRAYRLNPDNSFVLETYARTLISEARTDTDRATENAIEVLALVYAANARSTSEPRRFALGRLADSAFEILLQASSTLGEREPRNESEAIVRAVHALTKDVVRFEGMDLRDYPPSNRARAAELLSSPELLSNLQAVRLRYLIACLDEPHNFRLQLELLQSLDASLSPQLQLELAILLHQRDRHHEAGLLFGSLRRLWKREEHYVEVPERLRWLLVPDGRTRRQVHARVTSSGEGRAFAKVREFQDGEAVFRPEQFGQSAIRPGVTISGYISFGHNGPFLRPLVGA